MRETGRDNSDVITKFLTVSLMFSDNSLTVNSSAPTLENSYYSIINLFKTLKTLRLHKKRLNIDTT